MTTVPITPQDYDRRAMHEIATIERRLRMVEAIESVAVHITDDTGRLHIDTSEYPPHTRSTALANITRALVQSDHWHLVGVEDPIDVKDQLVTSAITFRRARNWDTDDIVHPEDDEQMRELIEQGHLWVDQIDGPPIFEES